MLSLCSTFFTLCFFFNCDAWWAKCKRIKSDNKYSVGCYFFNVKFTCWVRNTDRKKKDPKGGMWVLGKLRWFGLKLVISPKRHIWIKGFSGWKPLKTPRAWFYFRAKVTLFGFQHLRVNTDFLFFQIAIQKFLFCGGRQRLRRTEHTKQHLKYTFFPPHSGIRFLELLESLGDILNESLVVQFSVFE